MYDVPKISVYSNRVGDAMAHENTSTVSYLHRICLCITYLPSAQHGRSSTMPLSDFILSAFSAKEQRFCSAKKISVALLVAALLVATLLVIAALLVATLLIATWHRFAKQFTSLLSRFKRDPALGGKHAQPLPVLVVGQVVNSRYLPRLASVHTPLSLLRLLELRLALLLVALLLVAALLVAALLLIAALLLVAALLIASLLGIPRLTVVLHLHGAPRCNK